MCLSISKVRHHTKLDKWGYPYYTSKTVGKKPIRCYKLLEFNKDLRIMATPYQYVPIHFNKSGVAIILGLGFQPAIQCDINEKPFAHCGVHAYRTKKISKEAINKAAMMDWEFKEYPAIIPSGEEYFVGKEGDIVASKMIVFRTKEAFKKYLNGQETIEIQ